MCVYVFIFEKDYLCKIFSQINQKKTIIFLKKNTLKTSTNVQMKKFK